MSESKTAHRYGGVSSSGLSVLIPLGKVDLTEAELIEQGERNKEIAETVKRLKYRLKKTTTSDELVTVTSLFDTFTANNKPSKATTKPGGFTAAGLTYIEERIMEREWGNSLEKDHHAKPTSWGTLVEKYVHDQVNTEFEYDHITDDPENRLTHPELNWTGIPDMLKNEDTVCDTKCPWSIKSFIIYVRCLTNPEKFKEIYPEAYWQLISNAILTNRKFVELLIFMPNKSDLAKIKEMASMYSGPDQFKFRSIWESEDNELPYMRNTGTKKWERINKLRFEIPQEDKDLLTERVKEALTIIDNG